MRIGSDPEVFLTQNGKLKSVIGMIGAGKLNPFQVPHMPAGFTFQEDNVAAEFGIPPAASADEFVAHIQAVQSEFLKKYEGYQFSQLSCAEFPAEELQHPAAHIFGCEPDFDAWKQGRKNKSPVAPTPSTRSAGGHVHIETKLDPRLVVQAMDLFCGVPSVIMDKGGEQRRSIYGKAGAHRVKPYGVEYRTLSNFWIFDEEKIRWVWRNVGRALDFVERGNAAELKDIKLEITNTINKGSVSGAKILCKAFELEVVA